MSHNSPYYYSASLCTATLLLFGIADFLHLKSLKNRVLQFYSSRIKCTLNCNNLTSILFWNRDARAYPSQKFFLMVSHSTFYKDLWPLLVISIKLITSSSVKKLVDLDWFCFICVLFPFCRMRILRNETKQTNKPKLFQN